MSGLLPQGNALLGLMLVLRQNMTKQLLLVKFLLPTKLAIQPALSRGPGAGALHVMEASCTSAKRKTMTFQHRTVDPDPLQMALDPFQVHNVQV